MRAPRSSSRTAARQSTSDCCRIREWSLIHNGVHPRPWLGACGGDPFHSEASNQKSGRSNRAHLPTNGRIYLQGTCPNWLTERSGTSVTCFVTRGHGTDSVGQSSLCTTCLMLLLALGTHLVVPKNKPCFKSMLDRWSHSCAMADTPQEFISVPMNPRRGLPEAT